MPRSEIHSLVLGFFETIGAQVNCVDGAYKVIIPPKYLNYFQTEKITIAFDKDTASKHSCELMIPGSKSLHKIIINCSKKGPISMKKTNAGKGKNKIVRYHFFVVFSGIKNISRLMHVDVNLDNYTIENISDTLEDCDLVPGVFNAKQITPSYLAAIDRIQKQCSDIKTEFIDDANAALNKDLETANSTFRSQIRDVDESINKKERQSDNPENVNQFRFEMVSRIKELEQDKSHIMQTLQKKHQISIQYNLVGCVLILA